jgi:hypothetical protein
VEVSTKGHGRDKVREAFTESSLLGTSQYLTDLGLKPMGTVVVFLPSLYSSRKPEATTERKTEVCQCAMAMSEVSFSLSYIFYCNSRAQNFYTFALILCSPSLSGCYYS